jgi:uncharacterized protein YbjQ (UPF0145 family)
VPDWDGRGLPPAAAARVERFGSAALRTSLLSVPSAASLEVVGFDTVGEVMGCQVQQIGWSGYAGCGMVGYGYGYGYAGPGPQVQSSNYRFSGYGPYVQAVTGGYTTALRRMLLEASALKADGVVGVALSRKQLRGQATEFVALGTAVRARSRIRPKVPFTTDLPGTDFAKLLMGGWTPVSLEVAMEIAIRHDDYRTQAQAGRTTLWNSQNVEVSGYTELVQHTRALAREKFARNTASVGADGSVVSELSLRVWEIEPNEGHTDHVAEALITGTAIAHFGRRPSSPASSTLPILATRAFSRQRPGRPESRNR